MNIKEKIGKRIAEVRNHRGYTLAELCELTGFSAGRLSNWERGTRTPGPEEAIALAQAMKIDPAYLLCLVDHVELEAAESNKQRMQLIPCFTIQAIQNDPSIIAKKSDHKKNETSAELEQVPIGDQLINVISENSFAIVLSDSSMQPDFLANDVIIIDPARKPKPSDFVLVLHNPSKNILFRKYREKIDNNEKSVVELIPSNADWPIQKITDPRTIKFLGVMVEFRRVLI